MVLSCGIPITSQESESAQKNMLVSALMNSLWGGNRMATYAPSAGGLLGSQSAHDVVHL